MMVYYLTLSPGPAPELERRHKDNLWHKRGEREKEEKRDEPKAPDFFSILSDWFQSLEQHVLFLFFLLLFSSSS